MVNLSRKFRISVIILLPVFLVILIYLISGNSNNNDDKGLDFVFNDLTINQYACRILEERSSLWIYGQPGVHHAE